jgi:hypothetical protein
MANIYIGYNYGEDLSPDNATEGAATGSKDVELRIDTSKFTSRLDAVLIAEAIIRYIQDGRSAVLTE